MKSSLSLGSRIIDLVSRILDLLGKVQPGWVIGPRGGTLRKVPHHDHSPNWKMTPFAYQTQTVADPNHIQPILPWQPLLHKKNN